MTVRSSLQKAGGLQGTFSYIAFAPTRGVAVFIAINQFNFAASMATAKVANELIATLAPRLRTEPGHVTRLSASRPYRVR